MLLANRRGEVHYESAECYTGWPANLRLVRLCTHQHIEFAAARPAARVSLATSISDRYMLDAGATAAPSPAGDI